MGRPPAEKHSEPSRARKWVEITSRIRPSWTIFQPVREAPGSILCVDDDRNFCQILSEALGEKAMRFGRFSMASERSRSWPRPPPTSCCST